MAFYVRTPWLSVNSGTDVVRSGTRDVRRQFRDCPGHSGTVGNPTSTFGINNKSADATYFTATKMRKRSIASAFVEGNRSDGEDNTGECEMARSIVKLSDPTFN